MQAESAPASPSDAAHDLQQLKWRHDRRAATEEQEAEDIQSPSGSVIYQAVFKEGESELERNNTALAWSGVAAGLSMGFSSFTEAVIQAGLPDARWAPLIAKIGYAAGFLFVILGRQQLYTENTLTVILPLLRYWRVSVLRNVARLWTVVFVANLVGSLLFALAVAYLPILDTHGHEVLRNVSRAALAPSFATLLVRGVFAGWLIALLVWLLPAAETARIWVILIVTWLIGIAGFSHVIAGGTEVFALASGGQIGWTDAFGGFIAPALLGNIIGGVALVAAVKHAQFSGSGEV